MLVAEDDLRINTHTLAYKVLIIGLGQLGLPVAKYVKDKGFDVYGYDISQKAIQRAEKIASIKKADNFSEFDVYIICISTHRPDDMFTPQIDGLFSIVQEKIAKEAKNGALVSIESTIPRGTSKKVFEMLNHRLHVAHIPHRWYALEEKEHGVNQLRVVGGVCDCCLKAAVQFYGQFNGNNNINSDNGNGNGNGNHSILMRDGDIGITTPSTIDNSAAAVAMDDAITNTSFATANASSPSPSPSSLLLAKIISSSITLLI